MDDRQSDGLPMIGRPPNGYVISLYDGLRYWIPECRRQIESLRAEIEERNERLRCLEKRLVMDESTLAWMRVHQADEIAAYDDERERACARVLGALRRHKQSAEAGR